MDRPEDRPAGGYRARPHRLLRRAALLAGLLSLSAFLAPAVHAAEDDTDIRPHHVVPTRPGIYDLGSAYYPFRNGYINYLPSVSSAAITTLSSPVVRYQHPVMVHVSTNAIGISTNTDTANTTGVLFRDGNYRTVAENASTSDQYRLLRATATASLSGTHESGIRSGETLATNTRYFVYAVKTTDNGEKFVLVFTTATPIQANYSSLNTYFGTDGWRLIGTVFWGDQAGSTSGWVKFVQSGPHVAFCNVTSGGNVANNSGIRLATTASATTLTYTYAAGTASGQIPLNLKMVRFAGHIINSSGNTGFTNSAGTIRYVFNDLNFNSSYMDPTGGLLAEIGSSSNKADIFLTGFIDDALTDGGGLY